jgi:hypothetical protein
MSMTACRAYFRARANGLSLTEWTDGFSYDNIPSTVMHKSYHLECGTASNVSRNQSAQEIAFPVTARIFFKGYKQPAEAIDSVILLSENLIKSCCKVANSLTQTSGIKNVTFESFRPLPYGPSNDNLVIGEVNFRVVVVLNLES